METGKKTENRVVMETARKPGDNGVIDINHNSFTILLSAFFLLNRSI